MPTLPLASEYDASYFDGRLQPTRRNAGYSLYRRWERDGSELFTDIAQGWLNHLTLPNQKVLEVGCAKDFIVENLVDNGVDAYGLDVSDWCINTCNQAGTDQAATIRRPDLASRFFLGNALDPVNGLGQFRRNEFDVVISFRFLECIEDADMPTLVSELNRITRGVQVHMIDVFPSETEGGGRFYTNRTPRQWLDDFNWEVGTRITASNDPAQAETK